MWKNMGRALYAETQALNLVWQQSLDFNVLIFLAIEPNEPYFQK